MAEKSLWSNARISPGKTDDQVSSEDHRTAQERDYDRILFSSSVRRLSDKTQVFPLDENDSVRTRLTHSHEVSNLARSIGLRIEACTPGTFENQDVHRTVLPLLGAGGLAHDLGNPPFGHQGEAAISSWFEEKKGWIFDRLTHKRNSEPVPPIENDFRNEFTSFDGNPQAFRILARLHPSQGKVGLDLTAATLLASLKYPVCSANVDDSNDATKKYGYFCSEKEIVDWARSKTGLEEGQRHPLSWIVEAADDTAYSVLDVEDAMRKGIISPEDLRNILRCDRGLESCSIATRIDEAFSKADSSERQPVIVRDIKIGYARSILIDELVKHATTEFISLKPAIWDFSHKKGLMETSPLCRRLKDVAHQYAFGNTEVLHTEAKGRHGVKDLLDAFWHAIRTRKKEDSISSRRINAKARFVYSLFSANQLEVADEIQTDHITASRLRYRELRLLTDMVSGMTDSFTLRLAERVAGISE